MHEFLVGWKWVWLSTPARCYVAAKLDNKDGSSALIGLLDENCGRREVGRRVAVRAFQICDSPEVISTLFKRRSYEIPDFGIAEYSRTALSPGIAAQWFGFRENVIFKSGA
jgi:hypothetical protein